MADPRKERQEFEAIIKLRWETEIFPDDPDDVYELAELERPYIAEAALDLADRFDGTVEVVKLGPVID
jgi:hypothetical protein